MRFLATAATVLAVSVGLAAADTAQPTSGSSNTKCAAQNIVDACLKSTTPLLQGCSANDWGCLCNQSNNVLTCYNNCPGDVDQFGAQQTKESYCNAAKAYSSSSTTGASSTPTSSGSSRSSASSAIASSDSSATRTIGSPSTSTATENSFSASTSKNASTAKNAASGLVVEAGSLMAAMIVGLGAVL